MIVTQQAADALRWYHSIDLGNGIVTKGAGEAAKLKVKADVVFQHGISEKTVLHIGAWDGAYSFEAERRGASRVVAADYHSWIGGHWGSKDSFLFARRALNSRVEDRLLDIEHTEPDGSEQFDTVLLLGVIYHLKSPLAGIEHAAKLARETLVVETVTGMNGRDEPVMQMYPENRAYNWWMPNIACVRAMMASAGFEVTSVTRAPGSASPPNGGRFIFHGMRESEAPSARR